MGFPSTQNAEAPKPPQKLQPAKYLGAMSIAHPTGNLNVSEVYNL